MAISRSDKAVLHAFKLQAEVVTALFNDIEQLRDSLQESEGRVDILKTQLDSLQRPALSDATNENTTLRVDLAEAQSRLKTVQELVTEEKRKRELAEQEKYRYVTQYANQLAEITKLKEDRREAERNQDNQSNENMTTLVQYNALQNAMASLRLELEGKDREVHELTANTHALQEQLERAQATREPPQPSTEAQLQAVRERLDYEAMMQERHTFREQLAASQKENEELKTKVAMFEAAIRSGTGTIAPCALQRAGTQSVVSSTRSISSKKNGARKKGGPVDFSLYASAVPSTRIEAMASYPVVNVSLPPELVGPFSFTKTELSQLLGGSTQGLFVRVTKSARPLAIKYDISEYLCPNLNQNSWLPTKPGAHGYMQVGLGDRDRARFNEPEIRPVFVGAESQFRYFGTYELTRVEPLTVEEWLTLPEKSQYEYSETTKDKEKAQQGRIVDDILQDYRAGTLRAPCVLLKCIGFDMDFYKEFIGSARTYSAAFGVAATPASTQAPSAPPAPCATPAPCAESPASASEKRPAENRFHIDGAQVQEGATPARKRRRMSKTTASATETPRRSGRLSIRAPLPSGLAAATIDDDADADGISSDSGTEFDADDE